MELDPSELLRQVLALPGVDERERWSQQQFADVVPHLDRPYDEHAGPIHVTASAIVVGVAGVVLHRHKRLGIWLQPGGHIDPGEAPWHAAWREAVEETGLPIEPVDDADPPVVAHVDVHPGPRGHTHFDVRYVLHAPALAPAPPPDESPEVAWFSWQEAIDLADPGLSGALRALRPAAADPPGSHHP